MANVAHAPSHALWNRDDGTGLAISIIAPLLAVLLANGLYAATGVSEADPAYDAVSFSPPGWVVGAIWMIIYPLWGVTRWHARRLGDRGRVPARWVVALMAWGLIYPLVTSGSNTAWSATANVLSLGLAVVTALQVRRVSQRASWYVAPSIVWLCFASILGFAALQNA